MSSDITTVVKKYIETWNIVDGDERRAAIAELFAENVEYVDPNVRAEGRAALDAYIAETQQQLPGSVFALASEVSTHHDLGRFTWQVGPAGGAPLAVGYDFIAVENGQVRRLYGFFS
ncbi:nuclear transport factor 2 family protein [Streptomyces griseorubiginosus]|uniref:nuclear transport factor 2 family protein n=1 Tax=Streptomyces griseorubiginosus TaxID=67304 RepID=UPI002E81A245|nr:nuclear transport factor 2 family protein [Streptomyces griseorubiginosus]WUB43696.1 nuclear transport factor 2 family protein [Streptomyces griseorubiginosus]WUB52214.1 nuclear transport factor 2 family protein [Streptomyces griseorubiginosus]